MAVLTPVCSSVSGIRLASPVRSSSMSSGPPTSNPLMACVTSLVPSSDRIFSAMARPILAPWGLPASGISLPML